jgi:cytochrome c biogenesis protein CcdA
MNYLDFRKDRSTRDRTGWYPVLFIAFIIALLLTPPVSGLVIIEYFHQPGCINCEQTDPIIDTIRTGYHDRVVVEDVVIDNRAGVRLLMSYGVTEIPVVVINRNKVLSYPEITKEHLDTEIQLAETGAYPAPIKRKSLFDGDSFPSVIFSFCLGLMTGFSPCLLGSLVVLLAASGSPAAAGKTGKYYPLVFGAGIITAYLILAAVILGAGIVLRPDAGSRLVIYGIGGLVAIVVGIIQVGLVSLPKMMNYRVSALVSRFHTLPGIFLLGVIFAALFAPCAIAPFLVLIEAILIGNAIAPAAMVLAFSAGLFTPFVALAVLRNTIAEKKMLQCAGIVQKIGGVLLIVFGIWLIVLI